MGIHEVKTAPRSPWQRNPYVERLIGTLRRECLDHVVVLNEPHLRRLLREYLIYYHGTRTHLSLAKDAPEPRRSSALTTAGSSRPPWSEASIIVTVGERHKLLSAGCPAYVDVAGVRAPRCAGIHSSVAPRGAKVVHAGCPSYQGPTTKGCSRSQGT